ncbi:MAG: tRNA preQ1(34) S-adenosylmethionine ribosyltransferase-isomerase QueA [Coriobacteriia bacterium]|nr:tRNA preQ1(34) S-adenosylmethionine ribosyltransferase-isomerase QueA [Coriobacteriia bacterium]
MHTEDFDYELPSGLIAQRPSEPRDSCRLLVVDRGSGQMDHRVFSDLPEYLVPDDLLVVNETRVLPARLNGVKDETGASIEVLLLRERYEGAWECLVKPGRKVQPGVRLLFADGRMTGLVVDVIDDRGGRLVQFRTDGAAMLDIVHEIGEMPLPPYITKPLADPESYQTVFARGERSAAAPTAGLHFTPALLERCREAGAEIATVELDVGLDTFRPVVEEDPRDHQIHSEHYRVSVETAAAVERARSRGGRIIAVGTTSVRALESATTENSVTSAVDGSTSLFIMPGYRFHATDAIVTNFHVPRSTLLMMVSAFAGRELLMRSYAEAIERRYRFLSFGDAMLIV